MNQQGLAGIRRRTSGWVWVLAVMAASMGYGATAWAQAVGTIVQLTGTLSAQRGTDTRILSMKSEVQRGDTLSTQGGSFAEIQFTDGSRATLRPGTAMRIDDYQFNQNAPQGDGLVMNLLKGGLRTVTGLIGKRGNQDAYKIQTSTATIGIRGSAGDTVECSAGCAGLPPGVYHVTNSDQYIMVTKQGSILIGAGQFGFANDPNKPPVLLTGDPGLRLVPIPFSLGAKPGGQPQECKI